MKLATKTWQHAHPLAGRRIGVVGWVGSGRATLAVLLARSMTQRGYQVCFLDTDSGPSRSYRAFGLEAPPTPLGEFLASGGFGPTPEKIPYGEQEIQPTIHVPLEDLPETVATRTEEGVVFLSLAELASREPPDPSTSAWLPRDLRIEGGRVDPVALLKLEAGSQTPSPDLLASLDWVLVVADPTFSSLELAADMGERVAQLQKAAPAGILPTEPIPGGDPQGSAFGKGHHTGLLAVLNHIPDPETEQFFVTAISQQAHIQPIGAIREDWEVRDAGEHGWPVPEHKAEARVEKILDQIEESERQALSAIMD